MTNYEILKQSLEASLMSLYNVPGIQKILNDDLTMRCALL